MRKLSLWLLALPFLTWYMGVFCNTLVITANHGTMPVVASPWNGMDDPFAQDGVHALLTKQSHLKALSDWIQLPAIHMTASPGDLCLWLSDWLTVPCFALWLGLMWGRYER